MKSSTPFYNPVFWAEIAPCDHILQIYENDEIFLDNLTNFVGSGINANDCVVVIATQAHLKALDKRLTKHGIDVSNLFSWDRYIPLEVEAALSHFMVDGWPDELLFNDFVSGIISRARRKNLKVRAFGEMVAILWAQGHCGATVRLEQLWNNYRKMEEFTLFCAYPKSGFTQDSSASLQHICSTHSKVVSEYPLQNPQLKVA